MGPGLVGQAFRPAGSWGFLAPRVKSGDWKVAGTGRLESLPYLIMRAAAFAAIRLVISRRFAKDGVWTSELECGPEEENNCRA
jgi:hypothetical protein